MLSIFIAPAVYDGEHTVLAEAKRFVEYVKASPPAVAGQPVLGPGDVERRTRAARLANGVPLDDKTWQRSAGSGAFGGHRPASALTSMRSMKQGGGNMQRIIAGDGAWPSLSTLAFAQAWPSKPIRYVVPFAAGGTTDILGRTIGEKLSIALGQPVVVENKPGAGGGLGAGEVAKAPADGYTIMGGTISTHAINASLYSSLPYDPVKDFVPITLIARVPNMLVVNNEIPAKNVAELIALMKANPGKWNFASAGNGTSQHLSGELFKGMAGVDMQHIPYKGSPPALTDVMGGQVSMTFDNITTAWPLAKGGKLKALAVTTAKRSPVAPDVPTLAESGLPGYEVGSWQGVFAPAGTPPEIVKRLNAEIVKIINMPDVQKKLIELGAEPVGNSSEEFGAFVKTEVVKWGDVVKKSGAKVD